MPYKIEKTNLPEALDRRIKLRACQKRMVREMHLTGLYSIRCLTKLWGVSRRTIQFVLFPERAELNVELRNKRGGSRAYYDKDKHTAAIRDHRKYKQSLHLEGQI